MDWLLLAALGIMWVAFLMPADRRRPTPHKGVEEFEHRMELLAQAETYGTEGRWIVTPRKGVQFVGPAQRQRARVRERRRKVLVFLLESIGFTFLIGLVPPLRVAWSLSALLGVGLGLYVWLLVSMKHQGAQQPHDRVRAARPPADTASTPPPIRHVAGGAGLARPTFNGLGTLGEGDHVHVVVKPASAI
ncbi:MAG: hypothetical protein QOE25_1528 [Actinomycetota bacterium]|nr:hypothetical protein [Actinomycetota bacterium]